MNIWSVVERNELSLGLWVVWRFGGGGRQRWGEAKGERSGTAREPTSDLKTGVRNCSGSGIEVNMSNTHLYRDTVGQIHAHVCR